MMVSRLSFFFNDTATTEIYTLSLHDALPILVGVDENYENPWIQRLASPMVGGYSRSVSKGDRKSTRLNSSHPSISYAVFCLKKKIPIENEHCNVCYNKTVESKSNHVAARKAE